MTRLISSRLVLSFFVCFASLILSCFALDLSCLVIFSKALFLIICYFRLTLEEESPLAKRLTEYKRRKEAQKEEDEGLDLICKRYVSFAAESKPHSSTPQIG